MLRHDIYDINGWVHVTIDRVERIPETVIIHQLKIKESG
jgi:hypothetical protein